MGIDLGQLRKALAEYKVYNAWPYVTSLCENVEYMSVSSNLIQKVYEHRKAELANIGEEILQDALSNPGKPVALTTRHLHRTNLDIVGYEINDIVFLRKTTIEFIHYARVCMDLLVQITNAALFGDEAFDVEVRKIAQKVSAKLSTVPNFTTLKTLFDGIQNDTEYQYLVAFDNYLKHIKTILIHVENSIVLGDQNEFSIESFVYGGIRYQRRDALTAVNAIYQTVVTGTNAVLAEVLLQIPYGKTTSIRVHNIEFEQFVKQSPDSCAVEYISFFINVEKDLSDLPNEIAVYPLIIKPSGEIYSFDFRYEEIFIRRLCEEGRYDIIGCAKLKNGFDTNEFYRRYVITPCNSHDYDMYCIHFSTNYPTASINYGAVSGKIVFC